MSPLFLLKILKVPKNRFSTCSSSYNNTGNIYIKSTKNNVFCSLLDLNDNKIKVSCSLRVVKYDNEFNERVNLFKHGILLGQIFGNKVSALGYKKIFIYLDSGINKGRKGVLKGLSQNLFKISFIQLSKNYPHNGCRPPKRRRV